MSSTNQNWRRFIGQRAYLARLKPMPSANSRNSGCNLPTHSASMGLLKFSDELHYLHRKPFRPELRSGRAGVALRLSEPCVASPCGICECQYKIILIAWPEADRIVRRGQIVTTADGVAQDQSASAERRLVN